MFTGIITDIGTVTAVDALPRGKRIQVSAEIDYGTLALGASVSHAGVCLTVTEFDSERKSYCVEAWEEALRLTTAGSWEVGTKLNLERALRVGDELGGHIVSGHIDDTASIINVVAQGDATRFTLEAPVNLAKFIAPKGSVALDGTSLTVNAVNAETFDVLLIAHSLSVTTWGARKAGDLVNLEVDTMARYAARLSEYPLS